MKLQPYRVAFALLVSLCWGVMGAVGQETPPAPSTAPAAPANPAEPDDPGNLRERTIYVPYSKLRETFEKEGRGVYLPYEQFQELWRKAREADQKKPEQRPPAGVLISDIESEAAVERDVVVVRARLKLEILGEGWQEADLRLHDAAIRSAKIGDEPARITWHPQRGYLLLVKNDTKQPQSQELVLEYAKGFTKSPGLNTVSFQAPQAPVNRWRIRIAQAGVKVQVHPMIAATEETGPPPGAPPAPPVEETVLLAFVGAAPQVKIDWTPKSEGASGLDALVTAQAQQEVVLEEGVMRTRVRLDYEISRADVEELKIVIPANQKVTGVFDANVRQWDVTTEKDEQTVAIQLFEPAKKTQQIVLELERFSDELLAGEVAVPTVRAVGVGRQQGLVLVRLGEELRAEPMKRTGLLQVDPSELPAALKDQSWPFAYRYSSLPFELTFRLEKVKPRIRAEELAEIYLQPESVTLHYLAVYDIQHAGIFQLEVDLPAGYEVRQVRGQQVGDAAPAAVDSFDRTGEGNQRLRINLSRKAIGRVGLVIELFKPLADPNLLSPTGQTSAIELPIPRPATSLEATAGRVIVFAPESLRMNPQETAGLRSVSVAEAMQGMESQRRGRFPQSREVLAYVYTLEPAALTVTAERRRPQITARQLLSARIDAGVVKYEANFAFDILYSPVKTLRIDVPTELADQIRNTSPGIREKVIDPRPDDAAPDHTPWSLTGESEFLGQVRIRLTWEKETSELAVGESAEYPVPVLKPMQVDRAWGQIVIAKAETLDVNAKEGFTGLRPIDPQQDLMDGVQVADAARAFEFHDDWSLTMVATRYELEDIKRTSIDRAVLRTVVTRSDQISVQALYRVRSAVQRLAVRLPANSELDSDSLRINGRPVALERGDQDELFIPLLNQNPLVPFLIELRYTSPGDHRRLDFPVFPAQPPIQSEPAVQKVYLLAYLPDELALIGSQGPWTHDDSEWYQRLNAGTPAPDARQRIDWVREGIALGNNPADSFPTDGRLYEFTTLRPLPPPEGSLRLVAWNQRFLNLVVFGGLAVVGLVLLRRPLSAKLLALGAIIALLVLVGVFAPTLGLQVLDPTLLVAVGLVMVLWLLFSAAAWWRRPPNPPPPASPFQSPAASVLAAQPVDPSRTVDADTTPPSDSASPGGSTPSGDSTGDGPEGNSQEGGEKP